MCLSLYFLLWKKKNQFYFSKQPKKTAHCVLFSISFQRKNYKSVFEVMNAFLGQFFSLKTHLLYEFMRRKVYLSYWNYWLYSTLDILFSSNHNIHKSLCGRCFLGSDPLIDRFY